MTNGQLSSVRNELGSTIGSPEVDRLSDGQLLDRYLRHRDEGAFAALVQRYGRLVLGVCQRVLQDGHEAEDAFQATFLVLVRKADSLDKQQPLSNWLYEVAYRTSLKARGNAVRRRAYERQAMATMPAQANGEAQWQELRSVLDEELNRLPSKYRAPLVLCYLQGKSNQEAARELGWPSGSMSRRISRGRQILRDRLVRRGISFTPALLFTLLPKKALAAVVPLTLLKATLQAAVLFTKPTLITAGGTSAKVIALAEEVAKTVCKARLKTGTLVLAGLALFGSAGAGAVALTPASSLDHVRAKLGLGGACNDANLPEGKWVLRWQSKGTILASPSPILSVAVSRDGTKLAAGSADGTVKLCSLARGTEVMPALPPTATTFTGHQGAVNSVVFSPDGKTLASASRDRTIKLWASDTRQLRATLRGHQGEVLAAAFSPDGKWLASASADQSVRLWDVSRRQELRQLLGHDGPVDAVGFSADGLTLVSGGQDGTVRLWEPKAGTQIKMLQAGSEGVSALACSPNGQTVVSGSQDGAVKVWELGQAKNQATFRGHTGAVRSLAFGSNGIMAFSASQDGTMKQWSVDGGREGVVFAENSAEINGVACGGNPLKLANGSSDGKVRLWELEWRQVEKK